VDAGSDALVVQPRQHFASTWQADHVQVPHVLVPVQRDRTLHGLDVGQQLVVPRGGLAPQIVPAIEPSQLGREDDGLKRVEA
jgi:hypothetical protein